MLTATRVDDEQFHRPRLTTAQIPAESAVFGVRIARLISCTCDPTSTTCVCGLLLPTGRGSSIHEQ